MKSGSITIKLGDRISSGQIIGNVGNSGNTSEPHLHIQANIFRRPIVLIFKGHSYKRNDLMKI
jgi:murein DD-endopeptidase MepM/ murein hydrolase activator NlpD